MGLTDREKQEIQDKLNSRGARAICPMCSKNQWTIGDSFVMGTPVGIGGDMVLGSGGVPMAKLICSYCGFVSHLAIGALGFDLG